MINMICDEVRKFFMGEVKIYLEIWIYKVCDINFFEGCVILVK